MKIQILVPAITNRLQYIFSFIFSDILQLEMELYVDSRQLNTSKGLKFNYTDKNIDNIPLAKPLSLLFETNIQPEIYTSCKKVGLEKAFTTSTNLTSIDFDLFAAAFFLITRYEEYVNQVEDRHGRFPAAESIAYHQKFIEHPVIDEWAKRLKNELLQWYPEVSFIERSFQVISTIDVDNNYAYLHKSMLRQSGSAVKSILRGDFKDLTRRFQVLSGKRKDPFDTYEYLDKIHRNFELKLLYFILTGDHGRYDMNLPPSCRAFKALVETLAREHDIGIHPSYKSNHGFDILLKEKKRLEHIIKSGIFKARQHYLKIQLPVTYQNLQTAGIAEDFSMGFHDYPGFRAGTCTPFLFFDLEHNECSGLRVYPFAVMDVTLRYYLKLTPDEAIATYRKFIDTVKAVEGTWINLWHNDSVSDFREWKGWKKVFELSLNHMSVEK